MADGCYYNNVMYNNLCQNSELVSQDYTFNHTRLSMYRLVQCTSMVSIAPESWASS